ncbi:MAG: STAS domain-containing protein [Kouleothrix sp.]|nr:STAS domain-containing protein [Kouleothrix sp.]
MWQPLQRWLLDIKLHDPLEQRQAPLVQAMLLALIGLALVGSIIPMMAPIPTIQAIGVSVLILLNVPIAVAGLLLLRRDRFSQAVLLTSSGVILLLTLLLFGTQVRSGGALLFAFAIPICIAGLLTGWRGALFAVLLSCAGVGLDTAIEGLELPLAGFAAPQGDNTIGIVGGFVAVAAIVGLLLARFSSALRRALREAQQRELTLERMRQSLEQTVAERTADLSGALAEVETRAAAQDSLLAENERQRQVIQELSVPVLPVNAATLVMPLVGALDSARLMILQDRALHAIERSSARLIVLDISGVPIVDSQVALGILQLVGAARLLGTRVALAGVRPEVAQAMVGLGLNLGDVLAYGDLQAALNNGG